MRRQPVPLRGNDPLGLSDPLGLRPITDSELPHYRDQMGRNAGTTTDWVEDNADYIVAGAMIVGGGALMSTGVGGPAGLALMAASGGFIAAGASAAIQKYTTGEVDWGQVAVDGLIGPAATGAVGGGLGMLAGPPAAPCWQAPTRWSAAPRDRRGQPAR